MSEEIIAKIDPREFRWLRETYALEGTEYGLQFWQHCQHSIIPGCSIVALAVAGGLVTRAWFLESYVPGIELPAFTNYGHRPTMPAHHIVLASSIRPDVKSTLFNPAGCWPRYFPALDKRPDRWLGRWEQFTARVIVIRAGRIRRFFRAVGHLIKRWCRK
jgi:hypothetical protein